jgi:hypothetical protein
MLIAGCWHRREIPPPTPAQPLQEIVPLASAPPAAGLPIASTTASEPSEPFVDLEMVNAPVALVLQRLAQLGGLQLIIPAGLNRTISVLYVHVPVSVALKDVLNRSGLRLGSGPAASLPYDTATVFYHLPANVDSMSVAAIMKRFGVSRAMAELIVGSRRP